jgi:small subunit ribosomal protein S5
MKAENTEIYKKIVDVSRTAKVVKGGRRFRFGVIVVTGDRKGRVGIGNGKAAEVMDANEKATNEAKRNMVKIPLKDGRTLHHDVIGRFGAGKIIMRSAPAGTGIIAGGSVRAVCEALGIKDIVAKSIGSTNPHNLLKATMNALLLTRSPRFTAEKRGKKVGEIVSRREVKPSSVSEVEPVTQVESAPKKKIEKKK